ncbi:MAG: hypothetical protein ABIE55_01865 [Candidatus Aenigmatarchaeota archaeon]
MSAKRQKTCVLIDLHLPTKDNCLENVKKIPSVKYTEQVYGLYEALAMIETSNADELDKSLYEIKNDDSVRSINVLLLTCGWKRENDGRIIEEDYLGTE